jgi:hypothetical protein
MMGHSLLCDFCTVEPKTGTDGNGQPTYGTAVGTRARITEKTKILRKEGGTDIISTAQVTLPPGITVAAQDRVTLPGGTALPVLQVEAGRGEFGTKTQTVAFL